MFSSNAKEYRRHLAVQLCKEKGYTQSEVAKLIGVSQGCVSQWCQRVTEDGEQGLKTRSHTGRKPRLAADKLTEILTRLQNSSPQEWGCDGAKWTTLTLAQAIEGACGVKFSRSRVSQLLRQHGWLLNKS
ncbi:helix-turn-helix domain-containing protein [Dongshaea marina]|uniref:helix-turn-helix domain-containing protein n=1 Tax=Dongshaea marina TaxID=2047966 RepID=UPI00131F2799|nr:helix-turn-helix domain-containing protein [Dongshaea marina]